MPQNNEIVAALPAGSVRANKALLRAWAVQRNSFNLRPEEDLRDFVMIDPDGGGTTPSVVQSGMLYGHDPDDVTTDHDGVSCLTSYDAQRYKLESGLHTPFNVLDKDLTAPPPESSYGDAFLIFGSPTGAWAGKSRYIAILTARGWSFCHPPLGFLVYVRDESSYYHRDSLGAWVLGTGTRTLGSNSVALSNAINFGKRIIVENQTTNSVPTSPSIGDAYICGPSWPGGAAGKIAICEDGSTFTIYNPSNGWAAYDKARNTNFTFNGTSWVSAAGAFIDTATASYTANADLSATIPLDDTIPQIGEGTQIITIPFTPKSATNKLRVRFEGTAAHNTVSGYAIAALFLNSNANALAADFKGGTPANSGLTFLIVHEFVPGVTSSITLSVRVGPATGGGGLIRFNGAATGRLLGGVMSTRLIIEEIPAS